MNRLYEYYDWIKVIHIFSFVAWMAGLFYLPRLFSYHVKTPRAAKTFIIMEERLNRIIMVPALYATLISGGLMVYLAGTYHQGWFHAKITCVIGLVVFHWQLNKWRLQLKINTCKKSEKFFRIVNEIPSLLLILIIIFVIIKPF